MTHPITIPEPPAPREPADPGTQEIGLAPGGATPTTTTAAGTSQLPRVDADPLPGEVQATGPVGALPGLPGTGTPPPPTPGEASGSAAGSTGSARGAGTPPRADAPTSADVLGVRMTGADTPRPPRTPRTPRTRAPRERAALLGTGLAALSLLLLQVGLTLGFGDAPLWSTVTLWSVFATAATLLGFLPFAGRFLPAARLRPSRAWEVAAGGLTGVAVFWVLVVLPRVDSDRGFVLTAALAALGAALWVAPARRR